MRKRDISSMIWNHAWKRMTSCNYGWDGIDKNTPFLSVMRVTHHVEREMRYEQSSH